MRVFIQLGSNLGNRQNAIFLSQQFILQQIGYIVNESAIYETEPWMMDSDEWFLNQVIEVETNLEPHSLLLKLKDFEQTHGRRTETHSGKYQSRVIDMDILFYGNRIINSSDLVVPHPFLHERKFVLIPMNEINPDFIHPIFNKSIKELLTECNDSYQVSLYKQKISI
ncbi:MAG: 2-amino-4-hydroxy-6-hydroxymethyldihydropteridine diphosphokinase [Bacteroidales bacterium]|nr:2-amino-4-hydroxy-6-hydroxymethyldihydropteridine diphosphokinase [Bacteroidales bacterium]